MRLLTIGEAEKFIIKLLRAKGMLTTRQIEQEALLKKYRCPDSTSRTLNSLRLNGKIKGGFSLKQKAWRWRLTILFFLLLNTVICCRAEPADDQTAVQFFLKVNEQGFCDNEIEAAVFALDSYGLIAKSYEGEKQADIQIKETGGKKQKSLIISNNKLEFKAGQAKFTITDSEPEHVEVKLRIDNLSSPFPAKITFRQKSLPVSLQLKLPSRGGINQPIKAQIIVVDRKGGLVTDYSQKDITIKIIEQGIQDKSFTFQPQQLKLEAGRQEFILSDSQEEELIVRVEDPRGILAPAESRIVFTLPDTDPPQISEIKMETLAFVELTFNETLDDTSAADINNYEVVCFSTQHPASVELHNNKVILELEDLLRPHDTMYVNVKQIKDLSGNSVPSDCHSPNYSVPYEPLHLELKPSSNSTGINNPITFSVTVRCISGRVPKFINGKFIIEVTESTPDTSARLSSNQLQIEKGIGEFSVTDSSAEKIRLTIRDPENAVEPANIELDFI
ncbi:MAG: hypothetical protein V2A64_02475 [Candidatus Omnitrophota bacterium]